MGEGSGSQPSSLDLDKVIMDGTKLEEWPSILEAGLGERETDNYGAQNSSASWGDGFLQQQQPPVLQGTSGVEAVEGKGSGSGNPLSASLPNECPQSGGIWASSTQAEIGELGEAASQSCIMSKGSLAPENQESLLGIGSEVSGANSNPNCNSSAWPALAQDENERAIAAAAAAAAATEKKAPLSPSSVSSVSDNALLVASPPDSASLANQELQAQELGSVDSEHVLCQWDNQGSEGKTGPNKGEDDDDGDNMDSRIPGGEGNLSTSSSFSAASSSSSSWKSSPLLSSDPNTGASRAESWATGMEVGGGGGGGAWAAGSGTDKKGGQVSADSGWGALGNEGSCMTRGVSQGAWEDGEVGEAEEDLDVDAMRAAHHPCGSTAGSIGEGDGDRSGSNSVVSGSAGGGSLSQDSQGSLTYAAVEKVEDNQKGDGDGSAGVFTGQEESGGDSSISASQHRDHDQAQVPSGHQPPSPAVALKNILGRGDLDPRVLCNTGWGQTQIRQNVAWDVEAEERVAQRGSSFNSAGAASGYPSGGGHMGEPGSPRFGPTHSKDGWHDMNASLPSRGPATPHDSHVAQKVVAGMEGAHGKLTRDLSRGDGGDGKGKGWGKEEPDWRESKRDDGESGEWGSFGEQGTLSSAKSSGWGDAQEEKGTGGWKEMSMGDWRQSQSSGSGAGSSWKDGKGSGTDEGSWSNWDNGRPKKSWGAGSGDGGGGGSDVKAYQGWGVKPMASNQTPPLKGPNQQQQQQSQAPQPLRADPRALQEGRGRPGGAPHPNQSQSTGWTSGPIPQVSSSSEASGWEEPSPQSISRKMEIDDGTSAWGDPSCYNNKSVNLWDKNSSQNQAQQQKPPQQSQQSHGRQTGPPMNRDSNLGKGEICYV